MSEVVQVIEGFAFDVDAASYRIRNYCNANSIATRAAFLTHWSGLSATQKADRTIDFLIGSIRFPDEATLTSAQIAQQAVP